MPHNHSIHHLMNIKDQNIIFDENFCTEETVKGFQSNVFRGGTLTYQPEACYVCGHTFDAQIIKHFHTYLKLRKRQIAIPSSH